LSEPSPLGRFLSVASFSRGEGGDVKYTFMGGLGGHGRPARPLPQQEHTQQQQGECQHSRPGRSDIKLHLLREGQAYVCVSLEPLGFAALHSTSVFLIS